MNKYFCNMLNNNDLTLKELRKMKLQGKINETKITLKKVLSTHADIIINNNFCGTTTTENAKLIEKAVNNGTLTYETFNNNPISEILKKLNNN